MDHPFMSEAATRIAAGGISVVRFNFPYVENGKKAPDRRVVLEDAYAAVTDHVRSELKPKRLFLGGKSMGGRIASYLPGRGVSCDGLVFLGYPLHPPGRPERIRDEHLYDLRLPILFVEGTRDPFCPLDLLEQVRAKIPGAAEVHVIADGDHSFKVRKSSGRSNDQALDQAATAVIRWMKRTA